MKKVLFVATVAKHINVFHIPYLKWFKEQGYEVHVASKGNEKIEYCDKHFNLPFERFPLKINNIKTYKELKRIIDNNNYDIIHCHTPVGGVLARLAARKARKKGTKVLYTAHGFHFYKGAPLLNWLIYYPIEKIMAHYTNCLITIVNEDTVVMANATINPSAKIGKHCIINTGAVIEHDNVIEDYVHISPNATLCGTVKIGEITHVGAGTVVKNNINICKNCIIGAGATIVKDIKEEGTYVGVPARKIK